MNLHDCKDSQLRQSQLFVRLCESVRPPASIARGSRFAGLARNSPCWRILTGLRSSPVLTGEIAHFTSTKLHSGADANAFEKRTRRCAFPWVLLIECFQCLALSDFSVNTIVL
jgi:hypothetical protein